MALPLLEAVELAALRAGVPVDARIEKGRSLTHALRRLWEVESFDRIVAPASGFSAEGARLDPHPRPGRDDRPAPGAELSPPDACSVLRACPGSSATWSARPMASGQMDDQLLPISLALPIFSADAISSVAYATEAAMVVLVGVSLGALRWTLPIAIAVSVLMAIVVASYRQTVRAYAQSGGAYIVAKENLGKDPVASSPRRSARRLRADRRRLGGGGIFAITSAVSSLAPYRVELSLAAIGLIAFVEPPRRQGGRAPVRDPDVRLHPRPLHRDRHGHRPLRVGTLPARDRPASARGGRGSGRRARPAAGVLVRARRR